jgi:3-isopropylmalate dehydrogenase
MSDVSKTIVLLPGDGIGPEVIGAAASILRDCAREFGHSFELVEFPVGGRAIDACGAPLPQETLQACRRADAILLGAVGGPRWDALPLGQRPESGLLELRKELELYVNLRPICLREPLRRISPLKPRRAGNIDFEIIRELAGGIYFGVHQVEAENGGERAVDTETYSTGEIERVAQFALARAGARSNRLTSVDKANILATSVLWRKTVTRLAHGYPGVALGHMYVDNAAMQLFIAPEQFDVLVTSNMFGDILSDAAAGLVGSIGLVPSMSCGSSGPPLFEPIHGSAPTLVGRDVACPIGAILCASLMLRESFGLPIEAEWIETSVDRILAGGDRTADIAEPGSHVVGCSGLTERIRAEMQTSLEPLERYGWGV